MEISHLTLSVGIIKYAFANSKEKELLIYLLILQSKNNEKTIDDLYQEYSSISMNCKNIKTLKVKLGELKSLGWIAEIQNRVVANSNLNVRTLIGDESNCFIIIDDFFNSIEKFQAFMFASIIRESNVKQLSHDAFKANADAYLHISIRTISKRLGISIGKVIKLKSNAIKFGYIESSHKYKSENSEILFDNSKVQSEKWIKDEKGINKISGRQITDYMKSNIISINNSPKFKKNDKDELVVDLGIQLADMAFNSAAKK